MGSNYRIALFQVPTFKGLPEETLIKIADVLEEYTYKEGQCIIRQVQQLQNLMNSEGCKNDVDDQRVCKDGKYKSFEALR